MGYNYANMSEKLTDEFIDSLIYQAGDIPTYTHYTGSTTNPDLPIVATTLANKIEQKVIGDMGSDYRAIILTIRSTARIPQPKPNKIWNFRNAKLHKVYRKTSRYTLS